MSHRLLKNQKEWTVKFISLFVLLLFINSFQSSYAANGEKNPLSEVNGISSLNPGSELWRDVRQREITSPGRSQVKGVDSNVLINAQGDKWARFRMDTMISLGLYVIATLFIVITVFYFIRGRVNIEGGLSGSMVLRFKIYERVLHWVLALVFLYLAITGLILLFGRTLLIPAFGHELFSTIAAASKLTHNLIGPIFLISLVLMLFQFVTRNIYARGDLTWLLKGGGMIGKSHVTGGFFNMGEKSWYWLVILVGLVISITGLILVSPNLELTRIIMELSHVLHTLGAIFLIAVSMGHMYLGSIGTEGTNESMKSGYVDIKWAEAHHDRWAKRCHDQKLILSADEFSKVQAEKSS